MAASSRQCFLVALFMIIGVSAARSIGDDLMSVKHEQWMTKHGRVYKDSAEKDLRFKIFKQNVEYIESVNNAGNRTYKLGTNQFTDLTNEEFKATHNGFMPSKSAALQKPTGGFRYGDVTDIPESLDWRTEGSVLTPIKNQRECGCCWAFSAVAAVEAITAITTGQLVSLSEQELVDCDTNENKGCGGGNMDNAFKFIVGNGGLTTEENYPYTASDQGTCNSQEFSNVVTISGYEDVPANSESSLLKAVANQPVSVAIEGYGFDFRHYSSGVFTGYCGTQLTHAVAVVGYGTASDTGTEYWLVRNSWGRSWGENGYMRIQRDVDAAEGLCGIAMKASYPLA
ncbi:hypothetical protein J5N97_023326 [Dioscorea zingiberensis]|uniref:Uncharacterized protein n=1 Tax=Dioscorea zingiberensis TaxID=325984 RepID=A0A9D5CCM5_9LILI|nr:hypothetical protein J5N97_023326 [Dioscorea zingiberensis]